jgi:chemotaxis protein MotB
MAKPSWRSRTARGLALGAAFLSAGCALVPQSKLDACHRQSQTVQAENARLKDRALSLKSQYEDLAQRADDDARRLKVKDEQVRVLTENVRALQDERDKLAAEFAILRREIQTAANPISTSLLERMEDFAKGHPGCEFDPRTAVLTLPSDPLFEPGTDRLKPEASGVLKPLADLVGRPESGDLRVLIAGHTDDPPVRRAGVAGSPPKVAHLGLERAIRVRDLIATDHRVDAGKIEVAGFESSQPREAGPDDSARARNRRIEIRLSREAPGAGSP